MDSLTVISPKDGKVRPGLAESWEGSRDGKSYTFVRATLVALGAVRAQVGLRPTNPLTREPQIMASFLASLDSLTGGRAFMDVASGDSAVLNIGYRAASRARIEEYVGCIRALL